MWVNERGDGVNTCLDCGRKGRIDCGTYGSGMTFCEVHGVEGFDPKRWQNVVLMQEITEADVRARVERENVRNITRIKASINRTIASRGYGPCNVCRRLGMWVAEVHAGENSGARVERHTEIEALEALAKLLGVVLQ